MGCWGKAALDKISVFCRPGKTQIKETQAAGNIFLLENLWIISCLMVKTV